MSDGQVLDFSQGALDSIHERVLQGIAEEIRGLDLPEIGSAGVYVLTIADDVAINVPAILVTVDDETEEDGESDTFASFCTAYPVNVLIVDRADVDYHERRPVYLGWRRAIRNRLRVLAALPGVRECWDVRVKSKKVFDGNLPAYAWLVSGLLVQALCDEDREVER